MARGAEIYLKIEQAYRTSNWPEISRLAKKYTRRNDLISDWEYILEGMASLHRALDRVSSLYEDDKIGLSFIDDSPRHLYAPVIEDLEFQLLDINNNNNNNNSNSNKQRHVLVQAVNACVLTVMGRYKEALSLFNTCNLASLVSSPVAHLLLSGSVERANNQREMPMVESLLAVDALILKGVAVERVGSCASACQIYAMIIDLWERTEEKCPRLDANYKEAMYRLALLDANSGLTAQKALHFEPNANPLVRRLLLAERWINALNQNFKRHAFRLAVDVGDMMAAESVEEERLWVSIRMMEDLGLFLDHPNVSSSGGHLEFIQKHVKLIINQLALTGCPQLIVDFLCKQVYGRMPVDGEYYTCMFLSLVSLGRVSEALQVGSVMISITGIDNSVIRVYTKLCDQVKCQHDVCESDNIIEVFKAHDHETALDLFSSKHIGQLPARMAIIKAKCQEALGQLDAAIGTLQGTLNIQVSEAAVQVQATSSSLLYTSSLSQTAGDYHYEAASMMGYPLVNTAAADGKEKKYDTSRSVLSEPVMDLLAVKMEGKLNVHDTKPTPLKTTPPTPTDDMTKVEREYYAKQFPKDPLEFRLERMEHSFSMPDWEVSVKDRLRFVQRQQYGELDVLLELARLYSMKGDDDSFQHTVDCIRRLDPMMPELYLLLGFHGASSNHCTIGDPTRIEKEKENTIMDNLYKAFEYGGGSSVNKAMARLHLERNPAIAKMLLISDHGNSDCNADSSGDVEALIVQAEAAIHLSQFDQAGDLIKRALELY